ncbi:MAG: HDOD domain-containing protein [Pseudomonadales bacterium]
MTIPLCVLEILNNGQIAHEASEGDVEAKMTALRQRNNDQQLALMVLLENGDGDRMQAIISANAILNLDALNDFSSKQLKALNTESQTQLLVSKGLETLPAIPDVTGYPTLIDENLLNAKTLYLESGKRDTLITLTNSGFKTLTKDCQPAEIGISLFDLPPLSHNRETDCTDIYAAIRNYTSLQIKKRLADTLEIPPLSGTAKKILKISATPNAEIEHLVKAIEMDPSLAAQVVGWAASPYYSAPGKVTSIEDAIIRVLGFDLVLNLALGLAMGQALKVPTSGICSVNEFWRQAVYCALTMEKLNRLLPVSHRGEAGLAYLTGLMNNFGYLILNHVFPSHFATLCQYKQANRHINPAYIEQHLLGITGEQMTAQVAEVWNLPIQVNNAIRFQQEASYDGPDALYANLCYLSKHLLADIGIGNLPGETIPPELLEKLGLDPASVAELVRNLSESQEEIELMLSGMAA